jgi:hypothetical protein
MCKYSLDRNYLNPRWWAVSCLDALNLEETSKARVADSLNLEETSSLAALNLERRIEREVSSRLCATRQETSRTGRRRARIAAHPTLNRRRTRGTRIRNFQLSTFNFQLLIPIFADRICRRLRTDTNRDCPDTSGQCGAIPTRYPRSVANLIPVRAC